jgi:hypothetical protein
MTVTLQPPYPSLRDRMAQHVGSTARLNTGALCVAVHGPVITVPIVIKVN